VSTTTTKTTATSLVTTTATAPATITLTLNYMIIVQNTNLFCYFTRAANSSVAKIRVTLAVYQSFLKYVITIWVATNSVS